MFHDNHVIYPSLLSLLVAVLLLYSVLSPSSILLIEVLPLPFFFSLFLFSDTCHEPASKVNCTIRRIKRIYHKLHLAITPQILALFPRFKMRLKALIKTFQTMPKMCQSNQYSSRYQLISAGH